MSYLKEKKSELQDLRSCHTSADIVPKLHFQLHSKKHLQHSPLFHSSHLNAFLNGKRLLFFYKSWFLSELGNNLTSKIKHYRVLLPQTYRWDKISKND